MTLFVLWRENRPVHISGDLFNLPAQQDDEVTTIESLDKLQQEPIHLEEKPKPEPKQTVSPRKAASRNKAYLTYQ